jgi:hypothetical protein
MERHPVRPQQAERDRHGNAGGHQTGGDGHHGVTHGLRLRGPPLRTNAPPLAIATFTPTELAASDSGTLACHGVSAFRP